MSDFKNVSSYLAPNGNPDLYEEWTSAKKALPEVGRKILVCYDIFDGPMHVKRCSIGTYQSPDDFDGYGHKHYVTYWKYYEGEE